MTVKEKMKEIQNKVAQTSDEIRVKSHLAKKDAEVFVEEEVEPKMRELEVSVRKMSADAAQSIEKGVLKAKKKAREMKSSVQQSEESSL